MKKILCFDLDGVICTTIKGQYKKSTPKKKNIMLINELYENGHIIKIFTARYMTRCDGKIRLIKKQVIKKPSNSLKNGNLNITSL